MKKTHRPYCKDIAVWTLILLLIFSSLGRIHKKGLRESVDTAARVIAG